MIRYIPLVALIATVLVLWSAPPQTAATGVAAVSAGGSHSCALSVEGGLFCWGSNSSGQLGDGAGGGTGDASAVPVAVTGLDSATAVAAGGAHTCALSAEGGVTCWGQNTQGQLGAASGDSCQPPLLFLTTSVPCSTTPLDVVGLASDVADVVTGGAHTCVLTTLGSVKCWGANFNGQLGAEATEVCGIISTPCSTTPLDVDGLAEGVVAITAGTSHTCALMSAGGVKCWGLNSSGQLGALASDVCGAAACSFTPLNVCAEAVCTSDLADIAAIAAGAAHTCALTAAGGVLCWGGNGNGQLGQGTSDLIAHLAPGVVCADEACVSSLSGVAAIAAGGLTGSGGHTCVVATTGGILCWGSNFDGQLGDALSCTNPCETPSAVAGLGGGSVAVATGYLHTCAVSSAGDVWCWGNNESGQVGDGTTSDRSSPVRVSSESSKDGVTATPTPIATPPRAAPGDTNCNGAVDSIDALLILQFVAGLLGSLACAEAADVNGDGSINSIDAAIILQFVAGLLSDLES